MARNSTLTSEQKQQIAELARQGMGGRKIAEQLGLSHSIVRTELEKQAPVVATETVVEMVRQPHVREQVERNVFDITTGLQDTLADIQGLMDDPVHRATAPLRDQIAAVNAKASIYMHAATIKEKATNARAIELVLQALFAEYEQESPDIQQRILKRIGDNPIAASLIGLLGNSGSQRQI